MTFDCSNLQACSRHMAEEHLIEKTPQEWDQWAKNFIQRYRKRHELWNETDEEIWERIREMVEVGDE